MDVDDAQDDMSYQMPGGSYYGGLFGYVSYPANIYYLALSSASVDIALDNAGALS